jgi:putative PIN family toxin of toxin-antitoxin system
MIAATRGGPLKVVLDTNVYFSAFNSARGVPFELWRRALRRQYTLLVSPAIIRELADVLRADLKWPEAEIIVQLKLLARVATIVEPKISLHVIEADPDDDRILECALAGGADLIVSGDHHLTKLRNFEGIGIVRPAYFLKTLA